MEAKADHLAALPASREAAEAAAGLPPSPAGGGGAGGGAADMPEAGARDGAEEEFVIEIPDAEAEKIASCDDAINFLASHPQAK